MATYGKMTLREREDKSGVRKKNENSQNISDAAKKEVKKSCKQNPLPKKSDRAKYDDKGRLIETGKDLCDCLEEECPGCWTDCLKCGSTKCGPECRINRKYVYDSVEIDGTDTIIKHSSK